MPTPFKNPRVYTFLNSRSFNIINRSAPEKIIHEALNGNIKPLEVFMAINRIDNHKFTYMLVPIIGKPEFAFAPFSRARVGYGLYQYEHWLIKDKIFYEKIMFEQANVKIP